MRSHVQWSAAQLITCMECWWIMVDNKRHDFNISSLSSDMEQGCALCVICVNFSRCSMSNKTTKWEPNHQRQFARHSYLKVDMVRVRPASEKSGDAKRIITVDGKEKRSVALTVGLIQRHLLVYKLENRYHAPDCACSINITFRERKLGCAIIYGHHFYRNFWILQWERGFLTQKLINWHCHIPHPIVASWACMVVKKSKMDWEPCFRAIAVGVSPSLLTSLRRAPHSNSNRTIWTCPACKKSVRTCWMLYIA